MDDSILKLIQSDDYKERLQGEYLELLERTNKLKRMLYKYDRGLLDFKSNTSIKLLKSQLKAMQSYLYILDYRITIECPENWSSD